jgi:protein-tyrosine phosphatase
MFSSSFPPTQILSFIYLGSKNDAKNKSLLNKLNIKYIINCTPSKEVDRNTGCPNFFEKEKSFKYLRIGIFDNSGEDVLAHMDSTFKFIEEGKHYGNILIHCHRGVSRSATFVMGYLMRKNEMTLSESLTFLQSKRHIVNPNKAFLHQLNKYENQLVLDRIEFEKKNDKSMDKSSISNLIKPSSSMSIGPCSGPSLNMVKPPSIAIEIGPNMNPSSNILKSSAAIEIGPCIGPSFMKPEISIVTEIINNKRELDKNIDDVSSSKKIKQI